MVSSGTKWYSDLDLESESESELELEEESGGGGGGGGGELKNGGIHRKQTAQLLLKALYNVAGVV